jgi:hypothetical protein
MAKWEYLTIDALYGQGTDFLTLKEWVEYLNRLGDEGWELIGNVQLGAPSWNRPRQFDPVSVLVAKRKKMKRQPAVSAIPPVLEADPEERPEPEERENSSF